MASLREDAFEIIQESINSVMPEPSVKIALENKLDYIHKIPGKIVILSIGKAAYTMASAASSVLGDKLHKGLIVTKYGHSKGPLEKFEIIESGHPIPDGNSVIGATKAVSMVKELSEEDLVICLISGGGSSIFEKTVDTVTIQDLTIVTDQLLASGARIGEINTIRKHLSDVKGGRFALHCGETPLYTIVMSDVIGNNLDSIASGPTVPDSSTSEQALEIVDKYSLFIGEHVREALKLETPKTLKKSEIVIAGSVKGLCESAARTAERLGYQPLILTTKLESEAKEAGKFLASIAKEIVAKEIAEENQSAYYPNKPCAFICGGETVVHVTGNGTGGRSQELVLSASIEIEGLEGVTIFSVGSDGTDGPTDAAGGIVDGQSATIMKESGIDPVFYLENNDAYRALHESGDLIITGPTGTNVNDLMVILCEK